MRMPLHSDDYWCIRFALVPVNCGGHSRRCVLGDGYERRHGQVQIGSKCSSNRCVCEHWDGGLYWLLEGVVREALLEEHR